MGVTAKYLASHYLFLSSIKESIRMRGLLAVLTLAVLAVAVSSQSGPVYDEYKRIHCPYFFPDTKNYVAGRLNETVFHLEGDFFPIRSAIDAALDKVVAAQASACLTIGKLIAGATPAPPAA